MKNRIYFGLFSFLMLTFLGCSTDNSIEPENSAIEPTVLKQSQSQSVMHGSGVFAGPVFDLALLPNNNIIVGDVGMGIVSPHGDLITPLPGVSSMAPIGTGNMWATTGPNGPATENNGQGLYWLNKGKTEIVANLFEYENQNDPDGAGVDSNPYSVAAVNAKSAIVADAGANDLLRVDNKGTIELLAIFPDEVVSTENIQNLIGCPTPFGLEFLCDIEMMPAQAVPTSVAIGPDGYYYVGELKGFPAPAGASNIWRVSPDASGAMCGSSPDCVKAFDGGFTSIIDLTFGDDGMLYVAELDALSWFAIEFLQTGAGGTIKKCNPQTMQCETIASGIPILTAISFDKDGNLWATKNALIPELAEVIQINY